MIKDKKAGLVPTTGIHRMDPYETISSHSALLFMYSLREYLGSTYQVPVRWGRMRVRPYCIFFSGFNGWSETTLVS